MSASLKKEFLELLEKDVEFRYAVAGYLGLSEIMRRLDALSEEQIKIWTEIRELREEQTKTWTEMRVLREEQTKIWREMQTLREEQTKIWAEIQALREEQTGIWAEIRGLREEQVKLGEEQTRIWREMQALKEEQVKLREEQVKLREDFNKMLSVIQTMDVRLGRVERTLEKLTLDIEEEARSILTYRLKKELGVEIKLSNLILPGLELNIYGVTDGICIIGEASVRAGMQVLNDLLEKIKKLKDNYPEKLRERIIPVIYTSLPMPDLIERAREKKIWVLKATGDFVKPDLT